MLLLTKQTTIHPSSQKEVVNWPSSSQVFFVVNPPVNSVDQVIDLLTYKVIQSSEWMKVSQEIRSIIMVNGDNIINNYIFKNTDDDNDNINWSILMANSNIITKRFVAFAVFTQPTNLHPLCKSIQLLTLVVCKATSHELKQSKETSITLANILNDLQFVNQLTQLTNQCQLNSLFNLHIKSLNSNNDQLIELKIDKNVNDTKTKLNKLKCNEININNLLKLFKGELIKYPSNLMNGLNDKYDIIKVINSIISLFFNIFFISFSFGVIYDEKNIFSIKKVIFSTSIGNLLNIFLSNQPFITLISSPIITIWTLILYQYSNINQINFDYYYWIICMWSSFFSIIFSLTGLSKLLNKIITKSLEQIFTLLSIKLFTVIGLNVIFSSSSIDITLYLLILIIGSTLTVIIFYSVKSTFFLNQITRDIISDNSLIITLIIFSSIGLPSNNYIINSNIINSSVNVSTTETIISFKDQILATIYGLLMSMLIIVENLITNVTINKETGKKSNDTLDKNIFLLSIINCILATLKLPIVNSVLFMSKIHLQSLTKYNINSNKIHIRVKLIETILPTLIVNLLLCLIAFYLENLMENLSSLFTYTILFYLSYLVLHGNDFYYRLSLIFYQKVNYPINQLTRNVTYYKIHLFTIIQLIEIILLGIVTFNPNTYLQLTFPICFIGVVIVRHLVLTRIFTFDELHYIDKVK